MSHTIITTTNCFVITGTNSSHVSVSHDVLLSLLAPDPLEHAPHLVPVARVVGEVLEGDVFSHVLAKVVILGQLAERREHSTDGCAWNQGDFILKLHTHHQSYLDLSE